MKNAHLHCPGSAKSRTNRPLTPPPAPAPAPATDMTRPCEEGSTTEAINRTETAQLIGETRLIIATQPAKAGAESTQTITRNPAAPTASEARRIACNGKRSITFTPIAAPSP